jgi:peptidoglycan/xylan/chitin deacetylase (PgdA/CDA1 family)
MKDFLKRSLIASHALRLASGLQGKGAAILMYHAVQDEPAAWADRLGGIVHATGVFRGQMELLAREFEPANLEQVAGFVNGQNDLPRRAVLVTFDDGYADNIEVAAPILRQLGITAAFYVTVGCIESGELPWPARLRFAFRTTRREVWQDANGVRFSLKTEGDREQAFRHICPLVGRLSGAAQRSFIIDVERQLHVEAASGSKRMMMTAEQLRQLRAQGHIVGSHTMSHPNVAELASEDRGYELGESRKTLEAMLDEPVKHFAYPCPSPPACWSEATAAACAAAGYETSLTTAGGLARRGDNAQMLKRVRPGRTVAELRWNLECAFAGRAV